MVNYHKQHELKDIVEAFTDTTKAQQITTNHIKLIKDFTIPQMTINTIYVNNLDCNSLDFMVLLLCKLQYLVIPYVLIPLFSNASAFLPSFIS